MTTQAKYYNRFLKGAEHFSREIYEHIKKQNINIEDRTYKKFVFKDEHNNDWEIGRDYSLGILEMSVLCKTIINNKITYKTGWVYDKGNTNYSTYHSIKIDDLYFHISKTKSLL